MIVRVVGERLGGGHIMGAQRAALVPPVVGQTVAVGLYSAYTKERRNGKESRRKGKPDGGGAA